MIPTMLAAGLLVGRWWAVPALALAWPVLLAVTGTALSAGDAITGVALAGANAAVGVAAHRLLATLVRRLWQALRARRGSGTHSAS